MDCWDVLGVERFSDKKTIKIAYAKKLKQHRPDEDPEGFQSLHRAYKSALQWVPEDTHSTAEWEFNHVTSTDQSASEATDTKLVDTVISSLQSETPTPETVISTLSAPDLLHSSPENANTSEADSALLLEIQQQEDLLGRDWDHLYSEIDRIIRSKSQVNNPESWSFLEDLTSMNDLEFRKAAGDQVFEAVAEVNAASLENKHIYIKRPTLNYLNSLFSWDKKWQEYQFIHSRSFLNAVYPYLEEAEKPVKGISKKRELYYYRRGMAFALDLTIFFIPIMLYLMLKVLFEELGITQWVTQFGWSSDQALGLWTLLYFLFLIPIQEASKQQATIGKKLLSLQVIDSRGDRVGFMRSFWRSLVTVICCLAF